MGKYAACHSHGAELCPVAHAYRISSAVDDVRC